METQTLTDFNAQSDRSLSASGVAFHACTDVEEQARAFDGWNLNYTQISKGAFHGASSLVSLGGIRLLVERLDKVILQRGAVPADRFAVAVPLELEGHARMCGERSERDSLHVFSCLPEFEFYSPDRHLLVNVDIDVDRLSAESLRSLAASLRSGMTAPVIRMTADVAEGLRQLLRRMLAASTNPAATPPERVRESVELVERTILFALAEALEAHSETAVASPARGARHWTLINAIQERLRDPSTCPLSIAELCVELGLSRRTIQYAFREVLDLNPVSYLRAVRLNHVRRDLRLGDSVTVAATRWGFLHLGDFSRDYRSMFGELPSVTARRRHSA
ncbi:helix-turn-helix domain-containing protein [Burkholderia sp. Bp8963]|nr:helix-turn-helix domain-containing protein [Burkholderia sp. Bp8963]